MLGHVLSRSWLLHRVSKTAEILIIGMHSRRLCVSDSRPVPPRPVGVSKVRVHVACLSYLLERNMDHQSRLNYSKHLRCINLLEDYRRLIIRRAQVLNASRGVKRVFLRYLVLLLL